MIDMLLARGRIQAEKDLKELKHQYHDFQSKVDKERQNPLSEYDDLISKQQNFNESMENQVINHYVECLVNIF